MISILKNNISYVCLSALLLLAFFTFPLKLLAQESLTLSVTPTLIQMSATPGQVWKSSVKVINSNNFPLTVYLTAVNFAPQGEFGQGKFLPVFERMTEGTTLAEWIKLSKGDPIVIPPLTSLSVPFTVEVPEKAAPGGHFAAILVGTEPPQRGQELAVKTSQVVTSLFFVRLEGDVKEEGRIRSFAVAESFVDTPTAKFSLRFENTGNVHLQPQGQITIFNMWGKQRGVIPINMQTHFGNVLPQSIRNFEFSWTGESSIWDIGRYKAEAGLAYGVDNKKYETHELAFWVIPIKSLIITLLVLAAIVYGLISLVRAYIRRMLYLAGIDPDQNRILEIKTSGSQKIVYLGDVKINRLRTLGRPVSQGYSDFTTRMKLALNLRDKLKSTFDFIWQYQKFFYGLVFVIIALLLVIIFMKAVLSIDRNYEVSIDNPEKALELNAEEVELQRLMGDQRGKEVEQNFTLNIVNVSGVTHLAGEVAYKLTEDGYRIDKLTSDTSRESERTVIVFDLGVQSEAQVLSKLLGNALISADTNTTRTPTLTVFVGDDQRKTE